MKIALQYSPYNRIDLFEEAGFEVVEGVCESEQDMIDLLKNADGAQVNTVPLTSKKVLEACPKLKVISRMGVGVDSIDLLSATELGVLVCNVPGVNTVEVAEHAVSMLLLMTRGLHESVVLTRRGGWAKDRIRVVNGVRRIAAHTIGILGFGNIGRSFANRIRNFGPSKILAYDPYVSQSTADLYGVELVCLEDMLRNSDYISIHCSATEETKHIINATTLSYMKSSSLLVNTSRGSVVDGVALGHALSNKYIEAAALDVTELEPIASEDPLLSLANCYITPHCAGYSSVFLEECPILQAENIIRVLTGSGAPHGLANPEVIKTVAVMRSLKMEKWLDAKDFSIALPV